jgi:hypothetical protein
LTITKVVGTAAQLEALLEYVRSRVRPNSRIFMCVSSAIEEAALNGVAEVDETNFDRKDIMTLYQAWAALGHGQFFPLWAPKAKLRVRAK